MKRNMPGQPFANYVDVKSIDDFLGRIQAAGGTLIMPKQEIGPGMGSIAVFRDTEGNMMGLYQAAPAAKSAGEEARRSEAAEEVQEEEDGG